MWSCSNIIKPDDDSSEVRQYRMGEVTPDNRRGPLDDLRTVNENLMHEASTSARNQLEEIRKKAQEEGCRTGKRIGFDAGIEEGRKKISSLEKSLTGIIKELNGLKQRMFKDAEIELAILAGRIAGRIIKREISLDKGIVMDIVKDALSQVVEKEGVKVKVNPSDYEILKRQDGTLLQNISELEDFALVPDKSILEGGCLIETGLGDIDARIDKQIELILDEFKRRDIA